MLNRRLKNYKTNIPLLLGVSPTAGVCHQSMAEKKYGKVDDQPVNLGVHTCSCHAWAPFGHTLW